MQRQIDCESRIRLAIVLYNMVLDFMPPQASQGGACGTWFRP